MKSSSKLFDTILFGIYGGLLFICSEFIYSSSGSNTGFSLGEIFLPLDTNLVASQAKCTAFLTERWIHDPREAIRCCLRPQAPKKK